MVAAALALPTDPSMSSPVHHAFAYKVALARNPKTEAEYFPTLIVIPPAGDPAAAPTPEMVAHGFSLGVDAIRNLDPETERYVVTPIGTHQQRCVDVGKHNAVPELERDGWRVFIDWEYPG